MKEKEENQMGYETWGFHGLAIHNNKWSRRRYFQHDGRVMRLLLSSAAGLRASDSYPRCRRPITAVESEWKAVE
jgi:hypothetical protein